MTTTISLTAGEAATFATKVYDDYQKTALQLLGPAQPPVPGFTLLSTRYDPQTNYYGEAWKNPATNEVVIVSRGTVGSTIDAAADGYIAAGDLPPSAEVALDFARSVASNPDNSGATIISIGHSKGGFEAQYSNLALTQDALQQGGDPARFLAFTIDSPAIGKSIVARYSDAFGVANATNFIATTDPVSQLTFAAGSLLPGRTIAVALDGVANNPNATPQTCSAAAARAATILDSSNLINPSSFSLGLAEATSVVGLPEAVLSAWGWAQDKWGAVSDLLKGCNLAMQGHSSVLMANTLNGGSSQALGSESISDVNASYDSGNLRTQTVMSLTGSATNPSFQALKNVIVNEYAKRFGFGQDRQDPGSTPQGQRVSAGLDAALGNQDLTGAEVMDVGGAIYVRLASGEVHWVDQNGGIGYQKVTNNADGSTSIYAQYPDGTTQTGVRLSDGTTHTIVADASGAVIADKTTDANGNVHLAVNDQSGSEYSISATSSGLSVSGVDAGNPVRFITTPSPNGIQTTQVDATGHTISVSNLQVSTDGSRSVVTNYADGQTSTLNVAIDGSSEQVDYTNPEDLKTQTVTARDAAGNVTATQYVTPLLDDNGDPIANQYQLISRDSSGNLLSSGVRTYDAETGQYVDNSQNTFQGNLEALNNYASAASAIMDANSLLQAVQNHQTLPALGSTFLAFTASRQVPVNVVNTSVACRLRMFDVVVLLRWVAQFVLDVLHHRRRVHIRSEGVQLLDAVEDHAATSEVMHRRHVRDQIATVLIMPTQLVHDGVSAFEPLGEFDAVPRTL